MTTKIGVRTAGTTGVRGEGHQPHSTLGNFQKPRTSMSGGLVPTAGFTQHFLERVWPFPTCKCFFVKCVDSCHVHKDRKSPSSLICDRKPSETA